MSAVSIMRSWWMEAEPCWLDNLGRVMFREKGWCTRRKMSRPMDFGQIIGTTSRGSSCECGRHAGAQS